MAIIRSSKRAAENDPPPAVKSSKSNKSNERATKKRRAIVSTPHVKASASTEQNSGTGFFDLPREIRDQIYREAWDGGAYYLFGNFMQKDLLRAALHKYVKTATGNLGDECKQGLSAWVKTNKQILHAALQTCSC
jgi:hypothetical protein